MSSGDDFTPAQQQVITGADGPMAIVAGPGCGKTTTLAGRITHLVQVRGADPASILALSFTTESARRLRREVARQLGDRAQDVAILTLHALGRRVIDTWAGRLGYDDRPSVLEHAEAGALLASAATRLGWDSATLPLSALATAVDRCRLLADEHLRRSDPLTRLADAYEERLRRHGAIDFVAMLALPLRLLRSDERVLRTLQVAYRWVLVDEGQDLDRTQWALIELLAARHGNLLVAGDAAQCMPKGTLIETPSGATPVEFMRPGGTVLAGAGRGRTTSARVRNVFVRPCDGDLVRVCLRSGRVLRLTPDHMCFARLGQRRDVFFVYLMYRRGVGFRIGVTIGARRDPDSGRLVNGLAARTVMENADKTWVLRVCETREEAAFHEQLLSVTYAIPTVVFHPHRRSHASSSSQSSINQLFSLIDTHSHARKLMQHLHLSQDHPHHRFQAWAAGAQAHRLQVHLTMFGGDDPSIRSPWHCHRVLSSAGSIWRVDRTFRELAPANAMAELLAQVAGGNEIARWAALTEGPKFAFHPASHLRPTMIVPVLEHNSVIEDEIVSVEREPYQGPVYDLNVEALHNYVAGGVVVHNCIFGWRGADPRPLQTFAEGHPGAAVVTLDACHRSTGHLVALGNALSDLLAYRPPLRTDNPPGPFPRLRLAEDEHAEAAFVANQIGALLDRGLLPHPGEAAVLFRTRGQADVLAGALRSVGVPYAVDGHADLFGARAVRDMLAYLRLATNPADRSALARIVDTPRRGLGRLGATLLEEPATTAELPGRATDFGPAAVAAAAGLMATVYELHAEAQRGATAVALLDRALDRSGYRGWLEQHPEGPDRVRTLARLRVLAGRAELPVAEWLVALALGDELTPVTEEVTHLSSVHQAKGKEFRTTFVIGVEEGLLPHYRAVSGSDAGEAALEEELRVCYVALTRGRERLYLSACRQRSRGSRMERCQPSRWLSALPPELLVSAA